MEKRSHICNVIGFSFLKFILSLFSKITYGNKKISAFDLRIIKY